MQFGKREKCKLLLLYTLLYRIYSFQTPLPLYLSMLCVTALQCHIVDMARKIWVNISVLTHRIFLTTMFGLLTIPISRIFPVPLSQILWVTFFWIYLLLVFWIFPDVIMSWYLTCQSFTKLLSVVQSPSVTITVTTAVTLSNCYSSYCSHPQ